MKLSSTQINLIGTIGNLGMYAAGIPVGMLVDARGPKPGVIMGGICLGVGFLALQRSMHFCEAGSPFLAHVSIQAMLQVLVPSRSLYFASFNSSRVLALLLPFPDQSRLVSLVITF